MRKRQEGERTKRANAERAAKQALATKEIATALGGGDPKALKRREEQRQRESRRAAKENDKEKMSEFEARLQAMKERVARRPKLFQQSSIDIEIERAKQAAHDKFEDALRKNGLGNLAN